MDDNYDDMGVLSGYFAEFSEGGLPTSIRQPVVQQPGGLGATAGRPVSYALALQSNLLPPQGREGEFGKSVVVPTRTFQQLLLSYAPKFMAGYSLKSGRWDPETLQAWKTFMSFSGLSSNLTSIIGPVEKKEKSPLPGQPSTRVVVNTQVWVPAVALKRLQDGPPAAKRGVTRASAAKEAGLKMTKGGVAFESTPVISVQRYLNSLQANAGTSAKLDAKTKAAFAKWAKVFKASQTTLSAVNKNTSFVWMDANVLSRLRVLSNKSGRSGATSSPTPPKQRRRAAPAPTPAGAMVATTEDVQGILKRLGASPDRLSDGLFGRTTQGFWEEAATKRGKNPDISAKSGSRLREVLVNKDAYFAIKVDADAKTPPQPGSTEAAPIGGSLKTMEGSVRVPRAEFSSVLARASGVVGKDVSFSQIFAKLAADKGFDPRLEADGADTIILLQTAWAALQKLGTEAAPPALPQEPSEKANVQTAMATIAKLATSGVSRSDLAAAKATSKLDAMAMLVKMAQPADAIWTTAWQHFLAPMLIEKGVAPATPLKVKPDMASAIKTLAAQYRAAKKGSVERFKNYTEVNAAEVIARINGLGITVAKFDRSGGYKELADAIKTFLLNVKVTVPGDLVRTDGKGNTFVKNSVMAALATAVTAAQTRANQTRSFRDKMVTTALKESSASIPVRDLQQALKHTALSGQAGKFAKLYGAVKVSGAFDKPTRAAFTEIARTVTIGPAIQNYQAMLKTQLGPNFKTSLVVEARNQVWNGFLDQAVAKRDGKLSISVLPAIGVKLAAASARYRSTVAKDQQHDEQVGEQNKTLANVVKGSTATVSILNVQQALMQMVADKEIDSIPGLRLSGISDKATNEGLFEMSGFIFPEGFSVPEILWARYLKAVGFVVVPNGPPKRAWAQANYVGLPPAAANRIATRAGEWIARHGAAQVDVVKFNTPSLVLVKMPAPREEKVDFTEKEAAKKIVQSPAPTAKSGDAEQAAALKAALEATARERAARLKAEQDAAEARRRGQLATTEAAKEKAAAAAAAQASRDAAAAAQAASLREQAARDAGRADIAEREAAEARRATLVAQQQAAEANAAMSRSQQNEQQAAEAQAGGAQVTGPNINITTAQPVQAGMGGGGMAMIAAAGIGIALLLSNKGRPSGGDERYGS